MTRRVLEQYKKQAKELLERHKLGDPEAIRQIREHHPRSGTGSFVLADAQLVIAREHGFESWPKFAAHIKSLAPSPWESAKDAVIRGDVAALERLLREHPRLFRDEEPPPYVPSGPAPSYAAPDARSIIAREHYFESFAQFADHLEALKRKGSPVAEFEAAVEAVINGDLTTLRRLLRENPDLIRARSTRRHHGTLLHYAGANGVEGFRQRTPKNAVAVAETLLDAGAEVDAVADMYGRDTTLGLVATSIHPLLAGVQDALIETLLDHGAAADTRTVNACLANGRREAAEFLASRGAPLDLEAAAGVGRLDLVKRLFDGATEAQIRDGFTWACDFGRTDVVDFLLQRGVKVDTGLRHHGQTGLHGAACGGHVDTVKLLLERGAPIDVRDSRFQTTPLSWAFYGWGESRSDRYNGVVALLVAAGATVNPAWLEDERMRAHPGMLAALRGERDT